MNIILFYFFFFIFQFQISFIFIKMSKMRSARPWMLVERRHVFASTIFNKMPNVHVCGFYLNAKLNESISISTVIRPIMQNQKHRIIDCWKCNGKYHRCSELNLEAYIHLHIHTHIHTATYTYIPMAMVIMTHVQMLSFTHSISFCSSNVYRYT